MAWDNGRSWIWVGDPTQDGDTVLRAVVVPTGTEGPHLEDITGLFLVAFILCGLIRWLYPKGECCSHIPVPPHPHTPISQWPMSP